MKPGADAPGFEDFAAGDSFRTYRRTVTEADLVGFTQFAGMRLPIFVDDDYARRESPYGGRIVPGFLICAFSAGMMESVLGARTLAGLAMDQFRFKAPVRPGDTLHCRIDVLTTRETSDGKRGVLTLRIAVLNQSDASVLEYLSTVLMAKRSA